MPTKANAQTGVQFVTEGGIELPVVNITHPAFALEMSPAAASVQFALFCSQMRRRQRIPRWIRSIMVRRALRGSRLGPGLAAASGGFLDGVSTYLMKLGPANMGPGFNATDRAIAAGMPATALRLRLQDIAHLLASGLADSLKKGLDRPLHLVNIGGGVAIDSLNALILLRRDSPEVLSGRRIQIRVLDLRPEGYDLGERACRALQAEGAPLHGLDVAFSGAPYDWSRPQDLGRLISPGGGNPVVALSSEGALFEYGSDEEIVSNLQGLKRLVPADAVVVGSVTRCDDEVRRLHALSGARVRPRGIDAFRILVQRGGWSLGQVRQGTLSNQVSLVAG